MPITTGTMDIGAVDTGEAHLGGALVIVPGIAPDTGTAMSAVHGIALGTPMLRCGDLELGQLALRTMIRDTWSTRILTT